MIGLVVAVVGLSGVYIATIECSRMRRSDLESALAQQACRDRIEQIRALPFAEVIAQNGVTFAVDGNADGVAELRSPTGAGSLPGVVTVTTEDSSGSEVIYRVNVSVTWTGVSRSRSLWLETLVSNRVRQ